ncbi:MAG TPA: DUF2516 family protein [Streptosporangiaceae bacterium]
MSSIFAGFGPVDYFFYALLAAAFVVEAWAFIDAIMRPAQAFTAASKQTKPIWLIILGVALLIGVGGIFGKIGLFNSFLALPIIAFVAAAIYHVDVKPKVKAMKRDARQGPYGPW